MRFCHLYTCKLFWICVNLYLYRFLGSFSTRLTALCIIINIIIIVLISLVSLFKTIDSKTFPGELIDYKGDPLLSEPKRLKGSKTEYLINPCDRCEYSATITRCLNTLLRVKMKEWDTLVINVNTPQLQQVLWDDILRVNMKERDIPVTNVNTLQLM